MSKKYKLGEKHEVHKLYRVVAVQAFAGVSEGEVGGWVESEKNLNQLGNAWVSGDARVSGNAEVFGDARVSGNARVYGNAMVSGDARVSGNAEVFGKARVSGNAWVSGDARVSGNAEVFGDARVSGDAKATKRVMTAQSTEHYVTVTDTHTIIGCEVHTHETWLAEYKDIGRRNGYSEAAIKTYGALIQTLVSAMRLLIGDPEAV